MQKKPQTWAGELVAPIKDLSAPTSEFVSKITGAAADGTVNISSEVFGGIIGDRVKHWRIRNLTNTLEKTVKYLKKKGVSTEGLGQLPNGQLYTIFEEASKCDEDHVQNMWASLLASSASGDLTTTRLKALATSLSQFGKDDVRVLTFISEGYIVSYILQKSKADLEGAIRKSKQPRIFEDSEAKTTIEKLISEHRASVAKQTNKLEALAKVWLTDVEDIYYTRDNLLRLGCICFSTEFNPELAFEDLTGQFERAVEYPSAFGLSSPGFEDLIYDIGHSIQMLSGNHDDIDMVDVYDIGSKTKAIPYKLSSYGAQLIEMCMPG